MKMLKVFYRFWEGGSSTSLTVALWDQDFNLVGDVWLSGSFTLRWNSVPLNTSTLVLLVNDGNACEPVLGQNKERH